MIKTAIIEPDVSLKDKARNKMDMKSKPPGSLGRIEELAVQMCLIQNTLSPEATKKGHLVFAADHGVCVEGVSAFPAEVTSQMVLNFLSGGAAINVLCRVNRIELAIVDMGVNYDFENVAGLIRKSVRKGTRNFAIEAAMTEKEALQALQYGGDAYGELKKKMGSEMQVLGVGEMGIGNTTAAAAIISAVSGCSADKVTGRGTGVDDEGFKRKIQVIDTAVNLHKLDKKNGVDILCKVGGFEIAGMAGAALAAAADGTAVVLDGVISTAAGIIAWLINPAIRYYLISAHKSIEPGQMVALDCMGITPLLDLDMRLGEGTGVALAMNLIESACAIMCDMASFEEAGVTSRG